jgi:hydroxypyruvate isomerase
MLFDDVDFLDRFDLAAKHGFKAVEFKHPHLYAKDDLIAAVKDSGLEVIVMNMPSGNWAIGERGLACLPDRIEENREGVELIIDYAQALGCKKINSLGGIPNPKYDLALVEQTYVDNLRYTACKFAQYNLTLLIEPVNTYDSPGVFLTKTQQAANIIKKVNVNNLGIEYDIYNAQLMEGDLTNTINNYSNLIWHIQIADAPSRAAPGTGEINFNHILPTIIKSGYTGWIGCDYRINNPTDGFAWLKDWDSDIK